jgi:SulP family sulfate permease
MNVFANRIRKSGRSLLVCGARRQPATLIEKSEFARNIGKDNILPHIQAALVRAREVYSSPHPVPDR